MSRSPGKIALLLCIGGAACSSSEPKSDPGGTSGRVDGVANATATTDTMGTTSPAQSTSGATTDGTTTMGGAAAGTANSTSNGGTTASSVGGAANTVTTTDATSTAVTTVGGATSSTADTSTTSIGGATTSTTGTTDSGCEGGKVVHFVYFVEADATYSEDQRADIEAQAYAFQQYWYEQLGATFYLNEPIVDVIEADNESSWYLSTPDGIHSDERWYRLGNIKNEVYEKLGIQDFDPDHRVVNYPTTRNDGRVGGNFGGAWMDGDDMTCMAEPGGVNYPYDDGNAAHCLGHVAHEFGHVLGLDHQGPNDDCMQFGFYIGTGGGEMCDFSADNVAQILGDSDNEGWFEAEPGENCVGL